MEITQFQFPSSNLRLLDAEPRNAGSVSPPYEIIHNSHQTEQERIIS